METWQRIWRHGLAAVLPRSALEALRAGLTRNDPNLVQGRTMTPPPLAGLEDAAVEAACALGYCGWKGEGCGTVGELERYFESMCLATDDKLGEPCACRHFLDWFDATPRPVVRRQLLAEVERTLRDHRTLAA